MPNETLVMIENIAETRADEVDVSELIEKFRAEQVEELSMLSSAVICKIYLVECS